MSTIATEVFVLSPDTRDLILKMLAMQGRDREKLFVLWVVAEEESLGATAKRFEKEGATWPRRQLEELAASLGLPPLSEPKFNDKGFVKGRKPSPCGDAVIEVCRPDFKRFSAEK